MFAKSTISQSVIDSVNGVLVESDKKLLLEPQKREPVLSPFSKGYKPAETPTSSHTAKKVSTGTVYTKNYKAEKDVKEEVEELEELSKKTLGSYIKKSSQHAAGQTFDAAHKLAVRAMKGPAMQDTEYGDKLAKQARDHFAKSDSRMKGISKATDKLTREEKEGSHEDEKQDKALFKKLYKKAEDKDDKSEKETPDAHTMKSEGSFDRENREERRREHEAEYEVEKRVTKNREAAKAAAQAKKPVKEERHLSPEESAEKERIVKGMKKGLPGFKERYGNRAKSVMYATATKQAMKEEVESLDEGKMDKMSLSSLWHQHAHHAYGADQGYGGGDGGKHSTHAATAIENHVRKHHGNKCADDMCDHSDHHVAASEYVGSQKERDEVEAGADKLRKKHGIEGHLYGMHESVTEALKGKQSKLDKNHNDKLDAQDFKILRKEEKEPSFTGSHQGKTTIKHIKNPTVQQRMFAHDIKPGIAGYRDRIAVLKDAERMGNLKKEEVEELDELNKDTLHSYAKKAEVDQDKQFTKVGKAIRDNDPETGNKAGHKFSKRSIGLTKAYGKLEKEEVEHLDELGELPEAKKLSKTVDTLKGPTKVPT